MSLQVRTVEGTLHIPSSMHPETPHVYMCCTRFGTYHVAVHVAVHVRTSEAPGGSSSRLADYFCRPLDLLIYWSTVHTCYHSTWYAYVSKPFVFSHLNTRWNTHSHLYTYHRLISECTCFGAQIDSLRVIYEYLLRWCPEDCIWPLEARRPFRNLLWNAKYAEWSIILEYRPAHRWFICSTHSLISCHEPIYEPSNAMLQHALPCLHIWVYRMCISIPEPAILSCIPWPNFTTGPGY